MWYRLQVFDADVGALTLSDPVASEQRHMLHLGIAAPSRAFVNTG
jgi:hypothetical protein